MTININDYHRELSLNVRGTKMDIPFIIAKKFPHFNNVIQTRIESSSSTDVPKIARTFQEVVFDGESRVVFVNTPPDFLTLLIDFFTNDREKKYLVNKLKESGFSHTQTIKMCNDVGLCSNAMGITQTTHGHFTYMSNTGSNTGYAKFA
jgi:hypothetical protein